MSNRSIDQALVHARRDRLRTALEDAASVASLLITTEALVAEKPKKEAAPAMPAAGMDF